MTINDFDFFKSDIKREIQEGGAIFPFALENDFLEWFIETGKPFENSYASIPKNVKVKSAAAGNCFHNSQLVCLENDRIPYFEGIMRGYVNKSIIHHGFNLLNEKVLDVSYINNKANFVEELKDETFYYFGVEIENDYIDKFPDILTAKYYNNPIILKYYLDNFSL